VHHPSCIRKHRTTSPPQTSPPLDPPALPCLPLFTRMSTGPKASSAFVARFCIYPTLRQPPSSLAHCTSKHQLTCSRFVTSVCTTRTRPVAPIACSMSLLTLSSSSNRRAPIATWAPAFASSSAIAMHRHATKLSHQVDKSSAIPFKAPPTGTDASGGPRDHRHLARQRHALKCASRPSDFQKRTLVLGQIQC
jgi:hypothetical protein